MNEITEIKKDDTIMVPAKVVSIEENKVFGTMIKLSVKRGAYYDYLYVKPDEIYAMSDGYGTDILCVFDK